MKKLYNETFDNLSLSDKKRDEIRHLLSQNKDSIPPRNRYQPMRIVGIVVAVTLILIVIPPTKTVIAKTVNYIKHIFSLGDGTEVIITNDTNTTEALFEGKAFDIDKYYEISEKKIYFTLDDIRIDITDECSESTYYRYDFTDENGYTHIIFVGGDIENLGWAEFVFDADGTYLTNLMSVPQDEHWLDNAMVSIGVPTGNPELDFPN